VELWALIDRSTPQVDRLLGDAADLYLGEADARTALAQILGDEPEWVEILTVERVATVELSPN
jgi:hypothetical protein